MKIGVSIENLDGIWIVDVIDSRNIFVSLLGGKTSSTRRAFPSQDLMEKGVVEMVRQQADAIREEELAEAQKKN